MTKGDAPLKTTGHSQPAPEKREAQATEVILDYYLERNCHACYVTVQWKWKMKSAFRHSERLKLPLLSWVKNKKCLNHISNFRQAWESKEKWKSIMSVFSPQWWCQSVSWRSKTLSPPCETWLGGKTTTSELKYDSAKLNYYHLTLI